MALANLQIIKEMTKLQEVCDCGNCFDGTFQLVIDAEDDIFFAAVGNSHLLLYHIFIPGIYTFYEEDRLFGNMEKLPDFIDFMNHNRLFVKGIDVDTL